MVKAKVRCGAYNVRAIAGQLVAIPYHVALGILLLWHRAKSTSNVLVSFLLSVALGGLGGLIPLAFLTRRPIAARFRPHPSRVGFASAHSSMIRGEDS